MRFGLILTISVLAIHLVSDAQDNVIAKQKLSASSTVSTTFGRTSSIKTQFAGPINGGHVACDSNGNLYARRVPFEDMTRPAPVQEIRPDGTVGRSFSVSDASPSYISPVAGFFVGSKGEVFILAWSNTPGQSRSQAFVLAFGSDGGLRSTIQVDAPDDVEPYQVAVFRSGEILLSGQRGQDGHTPFIGVFNQNGKLIREVYEPEDEDLRKRAEAGETKLLFHSSNYGNLAAADGRAVVGSDGNIYVMRKTSPALIYRISPRGEVTGKMQVDAGDSRLEASSLQSAAGRIAVLFHGFVHGTGENLLRVVDLNGNLIASYDSLSDGLPAGALGCYAPPSVTFLTGGNNPGDMIQLNRFEAR